jgi:hypothetical protein
VVDEVGYVTYGTTPQTCCFTCSMIASEERAMIFTTNEALTAWHASCAT